MRLSQTKEATKEFIAFMNSHMPMIHPDYKRSRAAKGIRHEYIREVDEGLYAIHSTLCKQGVYHHCFCLSMHAAHAGSNLYSPFTIGGRSDHNYSILEGCRRDLGLVGAEPGHPYRLSTSHQWRKGADDIIRRCTSEAERLLLPYYRSVWLETRPILQAMIVYARSTPPEQLAEMASTYTGSRFGMACHMLEFRELYRSVPQNQREAFVAALVLHLPETFQDLTQPKAQK
jgi:hypothetical protein